MGLAIDGNEVYGIARGGQAFLPIDKNNEDGSITYNGQKYIDLANASLNITKIGYDDVTDSSLFHNALDFTISNFKSFSEYSFYQIMMIDLDISKNAYGMSCPFLIKPNVQMTIPASNQLKSANVLADNSGIHISLNSLNIDEQLRVILYGFK